MYARDNRALLRRVLPLLALAVLAGGCTGVRPEAGIQSVNPREMPLLVLMEQNSSGNWCAKEVIQTLESCENNPKVDCTVPENKKTAFRKPGTSITWIAVTAGPPVATPASPSCPSCPFARDKSLEFSIVFNDAELHKSGDDPTRGNCRQHPTTHAVTCTIDPQTKPDTSYEYGVKTGDCGVDPRIYVD
jgi:hypothetical protein